jgi:Spy/CpxP family protein refolding chaperone
MKLARLTVLTLALMVAGTVVAEAQGGRGGNRMNPTQMLLQEITLTAEQQTKVDTVVAKFDAEMTAFREKMGGGRPTEEARAEMMKMRTKLQTDLRVILTAEQQTVFDRNVEAAAQRMQRRSPPPARR